MPGVVVSAGELGGIGAGVGVGVLDVVGLVVVFVSNVSAVMASVVVVVIVCMFEWIFVAGREAA